MDNRFAKPILALLLFVSGANADYKLWLYAFDGGTAETSHTFAVASDGVSYHTISWMPKSLDVKLFSEAEEGVNLSYADTLKLADKLHARVTSFGPYKIDREFYDKFLLRETELQCGTVKYKAIDAGTYPYAMNCIHAVSNIRGRFHAGPCYGKEATEKVRDFFGDKLR